MERRLVVEAAWTRAPIVLLVMDDQDSLAMYALGLLAMGFHPLIAADAETGWLRARDHRPDVIVSDVTRQAAAGIALTRRLRDDGDLQHTGTIVLTGDDSRASRTAAREAGCDLLLLKPCLPDQLALHIRDLMILRLRHSAASV